MVKFIKKNARRFISLFIAVIMVAGMIPASPYSKVHAAVKDEFTVKIDSNITGDISVTLTNSDNPDETETVKVKNGAAVFEEFVDTKNEYDINITGMDAYEDYSVTNLQFKGNSIKIDIGEFTKKTFSITTSVVGENGRITPTQDNIFYGEEIGITATADEGYRIGKFIVDGVDITLAEGEQEYAHPFDSVQQNHTVEVIFVRKTWKISFQINEKGEVTDGENLITDGGQIIVNEGEKPSFTAKVKEDYLDYYHVSKILVMKDSNQDGIFDTTEIENEIEFGNETTNYLYDDFEKISNDYFVTVEFAINTYPVEIQSEGNGQLFIGDERIDPSKTVVFNHNEELVLKIVPDDGYDVTAVLLDESQVTVEDSEDLTGYLYKLQVTKGHSIKIVFDTMEDAIGDVSQYYSVTTQNLIEGYPKTENGTLVYNFINNKASIKFDPVAPYNTIKINGNKTQTFTTSTKINEIKVKIKDQKWKNVSKVSKETPIQIIIDKTSPTVNEIPDGKWTNSEDGYVVSGTVTDEDEETNPSSGLSRVVWSKDKTLSTDEVRAEQINTTPIYENVFSKMAYSFTINEDCDCDYYIYAVDNAGNVSLPEKTHIKIDRTSPKITGFKFKKIEPPNVDEEINFLSYGTFFKDEIQVEIAAVDEGIASGVQKITLYRDGVEFESSTNIKNGAAVFTLNLDDFASNEISASATDYAGNVSIGQTKPKDSGISTNADSNLVCLSKEKPEIFIKPASGAAYIDDNKKEWYVGDVGFKVDVSTESGGIHSVEIELNGESLTQDKNGKTINADFSESQTLKESFLINTDVKPVNGENTITVTAFNNYGNSDTKTYKIYIDTTNPDVTGFDIQKENDGLIDKIINFLTFGNFFNEEVKVTVTADDRFGAESGVHTITLYANDVEGTVKRTYDETDNVTKNDDGTYEAVFTLPSSVLSKDGVFHVKLSATATDNVGNITGKDAAHPDGEPKTPKSVNNELESNELMIEKNSPYVEVEAENPIYTTLDGKQWYGADTEFTITAKDDNAGLRDVKIQITDQDKMKELQADLDEKPIDEKFYKKKTTSETFRIGTTQGQCKEDGLYSIQIDVNDNAGNDNHDKPEVINVYKDEKDPYITGYEFIPATSDGIEGTEEFIEKLEYGYFFKTEFNAVIKVADDAPSSGLKEIEYRLVPYENGKKLVESRGTQNISEGKAVISIPKGFKGQIFVKAYDNTEHVSKEVTTKAYVVDDVKPEIHVTNDTETTYKDAAGNKLYTTDMSFTAVVTDYASGIKEIGYSKSAELENLERQSVVLNDTGYQVGDEIGDGWTVTEMDENLVTKATRTFTLTADDNDVVLHFDAVDHAGNQQEEVQSEKITIDKTVPVINVAFRSDESKNQYYYSANRIADITVTERNFDADLIKTVIENTFGSVPGVSFTEVSNTEHVAVIDFDEGDYTFDVTGKDLGEHDAVVNYSGGNEKLFYVDKTLPVVEENFATFTQNETEDSFKEDKTVSVTITEHNFDPALIDLKVYRKESGLDHTGEGLEDVSTELFSTSQWESNEDVHTLSFVVDRDSVYQIQMVATDLAENNSDQRNTVVFEIDKTVPIVKAKNGNWVDEKDTEFLDVYPYARKDEALPSVEFEDLNIDHIEYTLTVYKPDDASSNGVMAIKPYRAYLEEDKDQNGTIKGKLFTLPEFAEDGVYALELVAVDVAGNKSVTNINTYARMVEQDVLAYILNSDVANKTGLYSFQYENGDAISKRPDNFSDIGIMVFAKADSNTEIVLRDNNAEEIHTNAPATKNDSIYGVGVQNFTLTSEYFAENFQDDTDVELHLTAKNDDKRIDLGKMHIDNVVPECITPKELKPWHWYYGEGERKITLTNISEPIDAEICRVYDNGKEVEFKYSAEDNSVVFSIDKGWHNVGVVLKDMAGNTKNIQEISNIHVGFFWLWVIIASSAVVITVAGVVIILGIRRKRRLENE